MAKRKKRSLPPRTKSGRFRKRRRSGGKKRRRNPSKKVMRRRASAKLTRRAGSRKSRSRSAAAKKGWRRRKGGKKNWAKTRRRKGRRTFARNPFGIKGIPTMKQAQAMAIAAARKGAGAVGTEVVKATVYSTLLAKFRPMGPTSVAEDTLARLGSAVLTSVIAGYIGGPKLSNEVLEGSFTVALYKLVSDVFARATKGNPKLFGFIANPFTAVPMMPIIPAFGAAAAPAAPVPAESAAGYLGGVIPEGNVLPLGGVVPEGDVVPIGEDAELPERFRSRF